MMRASRIVPTDLDGGMKMCDRIAKWRVWPTDEFGKSNFPRVGGMPYTAVCSHHLGDIISKHSADAHVREVEPHLELPCCWRDVEPVKVTRQKLSNIACDVIDIVLDKNADYGDAWQRQGSPGLVSRVADKMYRVDIMADSGHEILVVSESLEDTLIDGIGYCMLGLLYLRARRARA